jgi:hypothetical protein
MALRQAIVSFRLAHADAQDAQTSAEAGSTWNAASLLHSAISRLIEAVVASKQGYAGLPEVSRIDARNPLKRSVLQLILKPGSSFYGAAPDQVPEICRRMYEVAACLGRRCR